MTTIEYLRRLQAEAGPSGFHPRLRVWVDDRSSAARVLRDMVEFDEQG